MKRNQGNNRWRLVRNATLSGLLVLLGCSDETSDTSDVVVSDSAGIQIVTNLAWEPPSQWELASTPEFQVGSAEGEGPEAFGFVSGVALVDGSVAVADPMNGEIRVFDWSGAHRFSVGRRGQGPGEFMSIDGLVRTSGDTLAIFDRQSQRITLLSLEEERFVGSVSLDGRAGSDPELVGVISEEMILFRNDELTFEPGFKRESALLTRASVHRSHVDTVGVFPGMDMYAIELDGERRVGALPFGRTGWFASTSNGFAYGSGDAVDLRFYNEHGQQTRSVRANWSGGPVDAAAREQYLANRLRGNETEEARRAAEQLLRALQLPQTKPAHSRILSDTMGNLWVGGTAIPGWVVFSAEGVLLAQLEFPDRTHPMHIGEDLVLALQVGEFDEARVVAYRIER